MNCAIRLFNRLVPVIIFFTYAITVHGVLPSKGGKAITIKKIRDIVIYKDSLFYCAFPSVIKNEDGELIVAFRRAPDRRIFLEEGYSHVDPNSYLVYVRSRDNGLSWSKKTELIDAYPFGGAQDPCMLKLSDGSILCTSYVWSFVRDDGFAKLKQPVHSLKFGSFESVFLGGYLLRSTDNGNSWKGPYYPPHIPQEVKLSAFGNPLPASNRGALSEGRDGRVFWVVAGRPDANNPNRTGDYLLISEDHGVNWEYSCPVAEDDNISFNEASVYETPKGDLVAFMRTSGAGDHACIARSTDGGKSFGPWRSMGFWGHPLQALRLPDKRVLLVYGYRRNPCGIRARVLNAECTDYETTDEIIIRDDGDHGDIGYPWAVMMDNKKILVVYYFNKGGGTRYIAGSVLEIS